ncbi:hypothetical protein [Streptomyces sp. NPDC005408]|uniref:hypothetical protein n=1 Tax=Streptomyces sp. NPDC005408 TaxID=3155341 RepID=UPI0033BEDE95
MPRIGLGRPRKWSDSVSADRRTATADPPLSATPGIRHTIPEKSDSKAARLKRGSAGGGPRGFDEELYKKGNVVERAINKLEQSRAVATRYDKRGYVFLGTVTAAAVVIWLRS